VDQSEEFEVAGSPQPGFISRAATTDRGALRVERIEPSA